MAEATAQQQASYELVPSDPVVWEVSMDLGGGNTCYAIGQSAAYIIEAILLDEKRTVPLSVKISGYLGVEDVCLSVPVVVGKRGVERYLHPNLNESEADQFRAAAKAVREVIDELT